jgi:hypothetical protein
MIEAHVEPASKTTAKPTAVMERLGWQTATRDAMVAARAIYAGEEIDAIHELSEAGLLSWDPSQDLQGGR